MMLDKSSHPRDGIDRRYVSRKEGGRGFASIGCINTRTRKLHKKIKNGQITATKNSADNIKIRTTKTREQKREKTPVCIFQETN